MTVQPDDPRAVTDWAGWLSCPVCRAFPNEPCLVLSGRVEGARPGGPPVAAAHPHSRRQRSRRARPVLEQPVAE